MILSNRHLLMIMLRLLYMRNGSLILNWRRDNARKFTLLKLVHCIPIIILMQPLYQLQMLLPLIFKLLLLLWILLLLLLPVW